MTHDPRTDPQLIVLFDAACGFCRWCVRQLRQLDRGHRMRFVALQRAETSTDAHLRDVAARYPLHQAIHVIDRSGRVAAGGAALLAIVESIPGGWLLRPWTRLPGVDRVVDIGYRSVAGRRRSLGRLVGARSAPDVADPAPPVGTAWPRGGP